MKKLIAICFLLSVCFFHSRAQQNKPKNEIAFITNADSFLNLKSKPQKPYFLYFTATWCAPCRQLQRMTFADDEVVKYVNKNVSALKIDVDKDKILKQKYYVSEYPTVLVFDKNGEMKMRFEGIFTADSFLETLKKS